MSNFNRVDVDQDEFIEPSGLMEVFQDIEESRGYAFLTTLLIFGSSYSGSTRASGTDTNFLT